MSEPKELRVSLLRSRGVQLVKLGGLAVTLVVALIGAAASFTPGLLVLLPVMLLIAVFSLMHAAARPRKVQRSGLGLMNDSISLDGKHVVDREDILSGAVVRHPSDGAMVRLERRRGFDLDLAVADAEEGEAVLEKLGLDVAHAVARFRVMHTDAERWKGRVKLVIGAAILFGLTMFASVTLKTPIVFAFTPVFIFLALSTALPTRITVGADGIAWKSLLRSRFLSFDGIEDVQIAEDVWLNTNLSVVQLLDAQGRVVHSIFVDQKKEGPFQQGIHAEVDARAFGLAERIREALEHRRAPKTTLDRAALARGDREAAAWVAHLRGLLAQKTTFRDAGPPSIEALLAVVEDASASAAERAAAAIALSRAEPAVKRRVRIAANAAAEPKLRIALDAAMEDRPEELAAALDELTSTRPEA